MKYIQQHIKSFNQTAKYVWLCVWIDDLIPPSNQTYFGSYLLSNMCRGRRMHLAGAGSAEHGHVAWLDVIMSHPLTWHSSHHQLSLTQYKSVENNSTYNGFALSWLKCGSWWVICVWHTLMEILIMTKVFIQQCVINFMDHKN